ncbi:TMEM175 family protein [Sphingobium sp. Sx8-8]|uniref:TMEM175 family protein n=1 Tax=Sphingobium sp. Sx8-8 TaxID=2933617 RepID=UPI001F577EE5|nr:TMEM175 family protein [Sphingobium sp. Sx8-8]
MVQDSTSHAPPRRDDHPGDGVVRSTSRLEAFADAVFAIAFTLPIVEIRLPEPSSRFLADLFSLWPEWLGYGLATLVIGIYWVQHHFSGAIYRTVGHRFLLATMLFLAMIGFIAFPTRAFADSLAVPAAARQGGLIYVLSLSALALTWWVKWRTGLAMGEVDERLDPAYVQRLNRTYRRSTLLMLVAGATAFLRWEVGLAIATAVTLFHLRPPETPVYGTRAPIVEGEA